MGTTEATGGGSAAPRGRRRALVALVGLHAVALAGIGASASLGRVEDDEPTPPRPIVRAPTPAAPAPAPQESAPAPLEEDEDDGWDGYGRRFGGRRSLVARGGGSRATEAAVEAGLHWLARHQTPGGSFSAAAFHRACTPAGRCADAGDAVEEDEVGATALAALALLGAGTTPHVRATSVDPVTQKTIRMGDVCRGALKALCTAQHEDGRLGLEGPRLVETHAIATLALAEAYGLTSAVAYRIPAEKAARFLTAAQNYSLGWGPRPRCGWNDTITTTFAVLALVAAKRAGLEVSAMSLEGPQHWLARMTTDDGWTARAQPGEPATPHPTSTAAGMVVRVLLGRTKSDSLHAKIAKHLQDDLPARGSVDPTYWHLGTLALFQYDGPSGPRWRQWNGAMASTLVESQRPQAEGCLGGSWEGPEGRLRATALDVLTLETYYRATPVPARRP